MKITKYPEYKTEVYEFPPHNRTLLVLRGNDRKYEHIPIKYTTFSFLSNKINNIVHMSAYFTINPCNYFGKNICQPFLSSSCLGDWNRTNNPLDWVSRFWQTDFLGCYVDDYLKKNTFEHYINIKIWETIYWRPHEISRKEWTEEEQFYLAEHGYYHEIKNPCEGVGRFCGAIK